MGLLPLHCINRSTWGLGENSLGSTKHVLGEAVGQLWVCSCRCEAPLAVGAASSAEIPGFIFFSEEIKWETEFSAVIGSKTSTDCISSSMINWINWNFPGCVCHIPSHSPSLLFFLCLPKFLSFPPGSWRVRQGMCLQRWMELPEIQMSHFHFGCVRSKWQPDSIYRFLQRVVKNNTNND